MLTMITDTLAKSKLRHVKRCINVRTARLALMDDAKREDFPRLSEERRAAAMRLDKAERAELGRDLVGLRLAQADLYAKLGVAVCNEVTPPKSLYPVL